MSDPRNRNRFRQAPPAALLFLLVIAACQSPGGGPSDRSGTGPRPVGSEDAGVGNPYVLNRDELENVRVRRFEELLVARFPSVRVSRRGADYVIRIRGAGNLTGGGDPLFIVDGMPTPVSSLANLNPADVSRIEVVPNHRTAFYGIRGAFGVIIVSTIRP